MRFWASKLLVHDLTVIYKDYILPPQVNYSGIPVTEALFENRSYLKGSPVQYLRVLGGEVVHSEFLCDIKNDDIWESNIEDCMPILNYSALKYQDSWATHLTV